MSQKTTNSTPDPRKVYDLKAKARREVNRSTPNSGSTSQTVLYGAHTENSNASGAGEYNS